MQIGHLEFFVPDPLASARFYTDVLEFEQVSVQGSRYVWLKCGDVEILLRPGTAPHPAAEYAGAGSAVVLYTEFLEETRARLLAKGLEFAGTDGSPECLTFRSPDGHWFQLVEST